jgi:hypothetical protein
MHASRGFERPAVFEIASCAVRRLKEGGAASSGGPPVARPPERWRVSLFSTAEASPHWSECNLALAMQIIDEQVE